MKREATDSYLPADRVNTRDCPVTPDQRTGKHIHGVATRDRARERHKRGQWVANDGVDDIVIAVQRRDETLRCTGRRKRVYEMVSA